MKKLLAAALCGLTLAGAAQAADRELKVYNWFDYITPETLTQFKQDCGELVERVLEMMAQALEQGDQVKLSGFGVFQVRAKRARMGRNPKTGEPASIEPRRVIGFRASQVMKARVDAALS